MCGRFTLTKVHPKLPPGLKPQYNISPSLQVWCVDQNGVHSRRWGLIPHWVRDFKKIPFVINARWESAAEKPFFREALKKRRTLIPTDGFFEWDEKKQPYWIRPAREEPFYFAGLWESWMHPRGEEIETCVILTTAARGTLASLHDRMPICLQIENGEAWLESSDFPSAEEHFTLRRVSTFVNKAIHQGPECIEERREC